MCRVVTRPELLRPPDFASGRTSDFSGSARVTSTKSATLAPRRPGVVGLYLRIPMFRVLSSFLARSGDRTPEDVDGALAQRHDGALGVLALARADPGPPGLPLAVQGVHRLHLDAEDALDRDADLGLVGPGVHHEGVRALVQQPVALLRHHRREQDVARVLVQRGHFAASISADGASTCASDSVATALAPLPRVGPARKAWSAPEVKTTSSEQRTS